MRGALCATVGLLALLALLLICSDPGTSRRKGMLIGMAVVAPLMLWWAVFHVVRSPRLVSISPSGITPHEWARSPIPWTEILATRLDSQGFRRVLVIETNRSEAVRRALHPGVAVLVRLLGWWSIAWFTPGIGVTLTLMSPDQRDHFLAVLGQLGRGPPRNRDLGAVRPPNSTTLSRTGS